jgi:hypothetical protein
MHVHDEDLGSKMSQPSQYRQADDRLLAIPST